MRGETLKWHELVIRACFGGKRVVSHVCNKCYFKTVVLSTQCDRHLWKGMPDNQHYKAQQENSCLYLKFMGLNA